MKTNDVIMVGLGLVAGYFLKREWDKRNAVVTSTNNVGVQSLPSDENFVFSTKYKDCLKKVEEEMAQSKYGGVISSDTIRKIMIDDCMKAV